jgi:hypothetical protein
MLEEKKISRAAVGRVCCLELSNNVNFKRRETSHAMKTFMRLRKTGCSCWSGVDSTHNKVLLVGLSMCRFKGRGTMLTNNNGN